MHEHDVLTTILNMPESGDPRVLIGPGDDLACVAPVPPEGAIAGSPRVLVGVDQVVDGLHINADTVSWDRIGRKAIHRALSDVAAMAGRPLATVATALIPVGASKSDVDALCRGLFEAAAACRAPLVGGDVAVHHDTAGPLTITVTALGVPSGVPVCRSGAQVGDRLVVTGVLGGSLQSNGQGHHLDFRPRLAEGVLLQAIFGKDLHAMIDISDGLGRDASRLAEASGVHVTIDAKAIPLRSDATWQQGLGDGEDYELLMAVGGDAVVPESLGGGDGACGVRVIGAFESIDADQPLVTVRTPEGESIDGSQAGWDHGR